MAKITFKPTTTMTFLPGPCDVSLSQKDLENELTILDVALKAKLDLDHTCGGHATCGTCLVVVENGLDKMSERGEAEAEFAADRALKPQERLACQNICQENLVVRVPHKTHLYKSR